MVSGEGKLERFFCGLILFLCTVSQFGKEEISVVIMAIGLSSPIWFCMGWRMLFQHYSLREAAEECKLNIIITVGLTLFFGGAFLVEKITSAVK